MACTGPCNCREPRALFHALSGSAWRASFIRNGATCEVACSRACYVPCSHRPWRGTPRRFVCAHDRSVPFFVEGTHPRAQGDFSVIITFVPRYLHAKNGVRVLRPTTRSCPRLGLVVRCGDLAISQKKHSFLCVFLPPRQWDHGVAVTLFHVALIPPAKTKRGSLTPTRSQPKLGLAVGCGGVTL